MEAEEIFNKITDGDIFLAYINDNRSVVVCRTNSPAEVSRLINNEGARVITFDSLLTCYDVYKSCDAKEGVPFVTFSDWIIGEV